MELSKTAVGFVAGACLAVGASGAYFATRDAARTEVAPPAVVTPVEQSEVVLPAPAAATPEPPAATPAPAARTAAPVARAAAAPPAPEPRPRRVEPAPEPPAPPAPAPIEVFTPAPLEPPRITDNRPALFVEPAGPLYDELVVASRSVIGLEIESTVSSEQARVEDRVAARVTRDVRVGDRVAIPAGSRALGEVTLVERGGRLKDRARLGVRFTSIVLADGTRLPIESEAIYREGDAPGGESAAKIGGGAIGGAIIGGILGGAKGAAIGGAVGAGGGSAAVLAGGRNPATLSSGSPVTVRLEQPVIVTVER